MPFLAPVFGAVGAAVTAAVSGITAASIGQAIFGAAFSFGLSFLSSRLNQTGSAVGSVGGFSVTLSDDPEASQTLGVGYYVTGGSLTYIDTYGAYGRRGSQEYRQNPYLAQVIEVANHPIDGISEVWVNGERRAWQGDITAEAGLPDFNSMYGILVKVKFQDGRQTAADNYLVTTFQGSENAWTGAAVGHGIAYVRTLVTYFRDIVNRIPDWKFVVRGARLYDPRRDSTVGGAGSHRWENLDSHEFTENPAVIIYNIIRGVRRKSHSGAVHFFGLQGVGVEDLPLSDWFAAMNVCDAPVVDESGRTVAQFRAGGEIPVATTSPADAIEALLTTCNGKLIEVGGVFRLFVNGNYGAPVATITDGDLLLTHEHTFDVILSLEDRANAVTASYVSRNTWDKADASILVNATYEQEDGRRITANLSLDFVQSAAQAQKLQQAMLNEQRRQRRHEIYLPPKFFVLEPGDTIIWYSDRNGYDGKLFRVDQVGYGPTLDIRVNITELDPSDYDWHPETDYRPVSDGTFLTFPPTPRGLLGFEAVGDEWHGSDGQSKPAILFTWDRPELDVSAILFRCRLKVDEDQESQPIVHDQMNEPQTGSFIFLRDLMRFTWYQVSARPLGSNGWEGEWGLWQDVLTPATGYVNLQDLGLELHGKIGKIDTLGDQVAAATLAQISAESELAKEIRQRAEADGAAALERAVDLVGRLTDEATTREAMVRQSRALTTRIDEVTGEIVGKLTDTIAAAQATALAAVDAESRVRAGETGALGARVDTVTAQLGDKASASAVQDLTAEVSAIDGTVTSHTSAITAISAVLPSLASASGLQSLDTRVTYAEQSIEAVGRALTQIDIALEGKASVTALTSLSATVAVHGDAISVQGQAITGLQAQVSDRVTASAFQTFQVSIQGTISSQATALTQVQVQADNATAQGRLMFDAVAGAGGATSRARLRVRTDVNGAWKQAGLYFEAGSGDDPAYAVVEADRFVIMSATGVATALFDTSGKIPGAWITRITTDQIIAGTAQFDSAFIRDASIVNAKIKNLEVDTLKLAFNSVNEINYVSGPANAGGPAAVLRRLVVQNPDYYPCLIAFSGAGSCAVDNNANGNPAIYLRIDGQQRLDYQHPQNGPGALFRYPSQIGFGGMCILPPRGPTFTLEVSSSAYWKILSLSEVSIYVARIKR